MVLPHVFEVTADTFPTEVLERSRTVPVLLDFWAEWCGPCKTLTPILEQAARDYGGAFVLGKVDTEREQELAYAFQVQSIPFVVLMKGRKPVDAFAGAVGDAELRTFLEHHGIKPVAAAKEAPAVQDPNSPEAMLEQARKSAARGDVASVRTALSKIPDESPLQGDRDALAEGLAFLEHAPPASAPAGAALARASKLFRGGDLRGAMEAILESVQVDRGFADGLARKAMLLCFAVAGADSDLTDEYRRRLATLLY